MNASINYSGFVDLLCISGSEKTFSADQNEVHRVEPVLDIDVEAGAWQYMDITDRPGRE